MKAEGPALISHYHRFNETFNQNEPEQDQEDMEKPTTSSDNLDKQ